MICCDELGRDKPEAVWGFLQAIDLLNSDLVNLEPNTGGVQGVPE